jgi:FdhD protein
MHQSITTTNIVRVKGNIRQPEIDFLAAEEPLEIRLVFGPADHRRQQSVSVTMRTPGQDIDLAIGFLFTEGIIQNASDIKSAKHCGGMQGNVVRVELKEDILVNIKKLERNFYTTSSCGVCGKASIDSVRTVCSIKKQANDPVFFSPEILITLPDQLRQAQALFDNTGGLHGCALFDISGNLILSREDVGRHNAVDKLIGSALQNNLFPLNNYLLLLSGRASFELIQKAWMAGIQMVAAVGAPSSLAVQMARDENMTLAGFLRNGNFNIYSGEERIIISEYENSNKS